MKLWDSIVDKYLTWKTGYDKEKRTYLAWREENINLRATTIDGMLAKFKHIILVDPEKFFGVDGEPCAEFWPFLYPMRKLGSNCIWVVERGIWREDQFFLNGIGNVDLVFVACNNDKDATFIRLKYT